MNKRTTLPLELDANAFARLSPLIEEELQRRAFGAADARVIAASAMKQAVCDAFEHLFGRGRTPRERTAYLLIAARLMRSLALDHVASGGRIGEVHVSAEELQRWTTHLEAYNPMGSRMVDLHYFAGCSVFETAAALGISPRTVIRDLRFGKERLQARLNGRPENPEPACGRL